MKYLVLVITLLCFSMNASAWDHKRSSRHKTSSAWSHHHDKPSYHDDDDDDDDSKCDENDDDDDNDSHHKSSSRVDRRGIRTYSSHHSYHHGSNDYDDDDDDDDDDHDECQPRPTFETACDLKRFAASPVGTPAFGFFQGYVVGAFRTLTPRNPRCVYEGSDEQAVGSSVTYLGRVSLQQCPGITATDAMHNSFEDGLLVSCPDLP